MEVVFNAALHVLLIGSLLIFAGFIFMQAFATTIKLERAMRVLALFAGAMIALGAQATGADYATFTVNALAGARPASAAAQVVTTVLPAFLGVGIGFYISRALRSGENMAFRVMCFVGMLATTAFIQVYARAASTVGFNLGAAALPNIAFTAGILLTAVFTVRTPEDLSRERKSSTAASLVRFLRESRGNGAKAAKSAEGLQTLDIPDDKYRGL